MEPQSGSLQAAADTALRVAAARAEKRTRMREAILGNDTAGALSLACALAGFSEREAATRVEAMMAAVTRGTP
jgi:hypothetical protein